MKKANISLAILALLALVTVGVNIAQASSRSEILDEDGTVYIFETADDGSLWYWIYSPDGTISGGEMDSSDPDSGSSGSRPSAEDIRDMARRHYHGKLSKGVQTNNPFALSQSAKGKGLAPRWNPPGRIMDGADGGSGSGPGSNGGGTTEWLKSMAKKGGNTDDNDSDSNGKGQRPGLGTNGSIRPERINPAPILQRNLTASTGRFQREKHATLSSKDVAATPSAAAGQVQVASQKVKTTLRKNRNPPSSKNRAVVQKTRSSRDDTTNSNNSVTIKATGTMQPGRLLVNMR